MLRTFQPRTQRGPDYGGPFRRVVARRVFLHIGELAHFDVE